MATKTKKTTKPKPKKIFTMTVVSGDPNADLRDNKNRLRARCWGYYFNRKDAAWAIENNATDMSELDYYHFAVLSEMGEGPMPFGKEVQWYEFHWDHDPAEMNDNDVIWPVLVAVTKISKPPQYEQVLFGGLS